jgi:hypothetical protein
METMQLFTIFPVALFIAFTHPLKIMASKAFASSDSNNSYNTLALLHENYIKKRVG